MVAASVMLLVSSVVAGSLASQSQTGGLSIQAAASRESTQVAQLYLERGDALSEARDYAAAIAAYTSAIQQKPDFGEAYNNRGFAYYLSGNPEMAIADFTRAIELRPNCPKAYNSRGVVYLTNGYESSKAIADFDRAIACLEAGLQIRVYQPRECAVVPSSSARAHRLPSGGISSPSASHLAVARAESEASGGGWRGVWDDFRNWLVQAV